MKRETEATLMAAHHPAITTNTVKVKIHKQQGSPLIVQTRMCKQEESVRHVLSECTKLAQTCYKSRHHRVADVVRWSLCHKYGLQCTRTWYEHHGSEHPVIENTELKILWDINIETDHVIVHGRPDIVVLEKRRRMPYS